MEEEGEQILELCNIGSPILFPSPTFKTSIPGSFASCQNKLRLVVVGID